MFVLTTQHHFQSLLQSINGKLMRSVQIASLKITKKWKYLQCKNHRLVLYKYSFETSQAIQAHPASTTRQDWKHQHASSREQKPREDLTRAGSWTLRNKPLFRKKNIYNLKTLITFLLYLLQENSSHFVIFTKSFPRAFFFFVLYTCMMHDWHSVTQ